MKKWIAFLLLISTQVLALNMSDIQKFKWDDLEVIYIPDERFPTYNAIFYFADGALSDGSHKGLTEAAFDLIDLGTRRYTQKDIAENLEYYAVDYGAEVTHESAVFTVSGLVKDVMPTMKMMCHLFADADYPKKELKREVSRWRQAMSNVVSDKRGLASKLFRELSMKGTEFSYPVSGKVRDLKKLSRKRLKQKLNYFNKEVKKRVYISGPEKVLSIKDVILRDCGWSGKGHMVRTNSRPVKSAPAKIYLVTVPKANQAQIRIGRILTNKEESSMYEQDFAAGFLGGGVTSRLLRVLRTGHGLVYGAGAHAVMQKGYGRAVISTSTANQNVEKLLTLVKGILDGVSKGDIPGEEFDRAQGLLASSYPFRFEKSASFLAQLVQLDHLGESYNTLKNYPQSIYALKKPDLMKAVANLYGWDKQTIFVLGTRNLKKQLKKFGKVTVIPYKKLI